MRKKGLNIIMTTLGYLLSPLSWWNDLILNIPLAYGFAFLFGLISKNLFYPMMIVGYWLTNIIGLILIHKGVKRMTYKGKRIYGKKELGKDITISIVYTLIVVAFMGLGWLKFPTEYFK
jgi:hypothetical protein